MSVWGILTKAILGFSSAGKLVMKSAAAALGKRELRLSLLHHCAMLKVF